jgi:hypothetical protein
MQLKLLGFEEEWKVEPMEAAREALATPGDTGRTASWQYRLRLGGNFWQRCLGRSPGLLVQIDLATPQVSTESLSDVILRVRACDCRPERGLQLLEEVGPSLLASLRDHLQLPPDRRTDERVVWVENVQVRPFYSEREIGESLAAQTTDISLEGMGLDLPCHPPCDLLLVELSPPHRAPLIVPVQGLHAQPRSNSRHHIGARFAWELIPE